ncbi:MAG: aldolase catalytic domain-containing protein [Parasporobacterium sp.]|nr:aldolase catalytic domain-containing protein [Parasporobacterium sp.]
MGNAELLDCTLRDGAYLVDKKFGDRTIHGIIRGLMQAKVDYIEIGFFQDDGFGDGKTVFKNSEDAKRFIPDDKEGTEFSVLADYSRFSIENLDECTGDSIDIVRECFFKKERYDAVEACRKIKEKGYKVFAQPVDILGYSDAELIELIELLNTVEPYCVSIVDTFGSMYEEDLEHVFSVIDHNLISTAKIGFHSHNNMQLSNALSQSFLRMNKGKRQVIVDGTISGMGRGAGNTPTELIMQYMVAKLGYNYDLDALLDVIDGYMDNIRSRCSWGYTTPYFIAGCYGAHVNNITYLMQKNSIRYKDVRYILNKIGAIPRKRYDYDLLEQTYMDYVHSDIDDTEQIERLKKEMSGKQVLLIAPGKTASEYSSEIENYIRENKPVVITINFLHDSIASDYIYISNVKRYQYWSTSPEFAAAKKILASNVLNNAEAGDNTVVVSFNRLIKCGWEHLDNSAIMLLRLLDLLGVKSIAIAGFDGYSSNADGSLNYANKFLELSNVKENPLELNDEIASMLSDYMMTRINPVPVRFITLSRFSGIMED